MGWDEDGMSTGNQWTELLNRKMDAYNALVDINEEDPLNQEQVIAAGKRWNECMTPLGIPDLPETPRDLSGVPTNSQSEKFGLNIDAITEPSQEELDEAVFDAKCRVSSGWTHEFYLAVWNGQAEKLRDDSEFADQMKANRAAYDEAVTKAREILAQQGGR
jgi:hypothetical protein